EIASSPLQRRTCVRAEVASLRSPGTISSSRCQITRNRLLEEQRGCETCFFTDEMSVHRSKTFSKSGDQAAWWSQTGSNRRPPACKAGALPTELWPRLAVNQLKKPEDWWAWEDLNFRPHAYQARALTN